MISAYIHMVYHKKQKGEALEGTERIEAFSDAVIAIIVTILILEIHVPVINPLTNASAWHAVVAMLPKIVIFFISFLTVAIFWVNHHHFFHPIDKSNGALLWYNNHLLFWLAVIPFGTAFIGDYPTVSLVVAIYGFILSMGATAFMLMMRYVFFYSHLLPETVSLTSRKAQYKRVWFGVILYGASVPLAFVHPYISLIIFVILPLYYFLPQRILQEDRAI